MPTTLGRTYCVAVGNGRICEFLMGDVRTSLSFVLQSKNKGIPLLKGVTIQTYWTLKIDLDFDYYKYEQFCDLNLADLILSPLHHAFKEFRFVWSGVHVPAAHCDSFHVKVVVLL